MITDYPWWSIFVGYLFSIIPSSFFIKRMTTNAYQKVGTYDSEKIEKFNLKTPDPYFRWTSFLIGILERIIFTTSVIIGQTSFIPIWLVFKSISQWKNWEIDNGRAMFNIFLLGTGFSILYGALGGQVIIWLSFGDLTEVLISTISLILLSIGFNIYINKQLSYKSEK